MTFVFWWRDVFLPPEKVILEAGVKRGDVVLDFGCGPGSYAMAAAEIVGEPGRVYAADLQPLALRMVNKRATERQLWNVKELRTDCAVDLENETVDVVLFYDVLHRLAKPDRVLEELHRVLKPGGTLSVADHHLRDEEILWRMQARGLFEFIEHGHRTFKFARV